MTEFFFKTRKLFSGSLFLSAFLALLLIIVSFFSWKFSKEHTIQHSINAMKCFEAFEKELNFLKNDNENKSTSSFRVKGALILLRKKYGDTIYAPIAILSSAKHLYQLNEDFEFLYENISWVSNQRKYNFLHDLARLLLSGFLLDRSEYHLAMMELENPTDEFSGIFLDRKGDILLAQGMIEEAKESWKLASRNLKEDDPLRSIIQLKISHL